MANRSYTPYELTQLARYGRSKTFKGDLSSAPVEYITGQVEFCGMVFAVSPAVLIPRVETEQLVELVLQEISAKIGQQHPMTIAEIGTGSGAISIVIARQLAQHKIKANLIATDIDRLALSMAQKNRQQLLDKTCPRIKFLHSDLWQAFPQMRLDIIVANLPYIPSSYVDRLDDSVIKHEPRIALDGGEDGLDLIGKLLDQAPQYLNKDGVVLLEINHTHQLKDFIKWQSSFDLEIMPDENGANRYLRAKLKPH